MRGICLALAIV